jgi:hypothetical protein
MFDTSSGRSFGLTTHTSYSTLLNEVCKLNPPGNLEIPKYRENNLITTMQLGIIAKSNSLPFHLYIIIVLIIPLLEESS